MNLSQTEDAIILDPAGPADAAVVWMHGLGADGNDFVPIVPELGLPADHRIRFIFPHAPVRPITINNGMQMRGWFDILSLEKLNLQDEAGIRQAQSIVEGYLSKQIATGIEAGRIVLAGFSQGGAIALHTALRYPVPLAGVLALSTFLPLHEAFLQEHHHANANTPILMCHGSDDPVLPLALGEWSRDFLLAQGFGVRWEEYPMQHQVCAAQIAHIATWLQQQLSTQSTA